MARRKHKSKSVGIIIPKRVLVTLDVYYHMPKHVHLINEFVWQTEDVYPQFSRVKQFMDFWQKSIEAVISEVVMSYCDQGKWTRVDFEKVIK